MSSKNNHPNLIILQTTNICNGKCKVCPYPEVYKNETKEVMSPIIWSKIYNELKDINYTNYIGFYLQYEPLTDPLLISRIKQLNYIGIENIIITTNGSLLTHEFIVELHKLKYMMISVSLLGTYEDYNNMTGFNYNIIKNKIKIMEYMGIDVHINCSIQDNHQRQIIISDFKSLYDKNHIYFSIPDSRAGYFKDKKTSLDEWCLFVNNDDNRKACVGMRDFISIYHDGVVPFCPQDWIGETNYGNIMNDTIIDIYNSKKYNDDFDKLSRGIMTHKICRNCYNELGFECKK